VTAAAQLPIRILIADDHRATREGLALLLQGEGFTVCAEVGTRAEALAAAEASPPDLAIVDLFTGEDDGLLLIAGLRARLVPAVVCSGEEGPVAVLRALAAGAQAYVAKREADQLLIPVIHKVLAGWMLVTPRAAGEV
jgi:DNA-binding NarL/FixJ family response regulator